tara:strand:+ start:110 stop:376 length:267 start_codon:yes stop_codon:yes gene_type:complete
MSDNILEKQQLAQIKLINEGMALKILKWLMKPAVKRAMKKLTRDPELKAAIADHAYHTERLKTIMDELGDNADPKIKKMANLALNMYR